MIFFFLFKLTSVNEYLGLKPIFFHTTELIVAKFSIEKQKIFL